MNVEGWIATPLRWTRSVTGAYVSWRAQGPNGELLSLVVGNPPTEDLFTLCVDGDPIGGLKSWPPTWVMPDITSDAKKCATMNGNALTDWLNTPISWTKTDAQTKRVGNLWITHRATGPAGEKLMLALGDFPAEDLYTLYVDGTAVVTLNDFPPAWNGESDGGENEPTGKCPHCGK